MSAAHHSSEYEVIWLVRRLFRSLAYKSNEMLEELEITAADRAVMEFLYPDKKLSVPEIASRYRVSRQHVQVTINPLVERGLLLTEPNLRHKRSVLVALTKSGRALFKSVINRESRVIDELFSEISSSNVKTTAATLNALLSALTEGEIK